MLAGIRVLLAALLTTLLLTALSQLLLVCLVLGIGIIAALTLTLTIVAWMSLRVAGIIGTILSTGLTVLETTVLRRAKGVLTTRASEALLLVGVLLVPLRRILLLFTVALAVTLLRRIAATAAAVTLLRILVLLTVARIRIVGAGHLGDSVFCVIRRVIDLGCYSWWVCGVDGRAEDRE